MELNTRRLFCHSHWDFSKEENWLGQIFLLSGRRRIRTNHGNCGSKQHWICDIPSIPWFHDQRNCWHWYRWSGYGIISNSRRGQGKQRDAIFVRQESLEYPKRGARFSNVPKLSGPISGATISFMCSQCRGSKSSNFAILLVLLTWKTW